MARIPEYYDIHDRYSNWYGPLPFIKDMRITEYVMNVNVIKRACFVKNKVRFFPQNQDTASELHDELRRQHSKFVYRLHSNSKMNKFVAKICPTRGATDDNTTVITAKIEEKTEAEEQFRKAKSEDKAAVMATLDNYATDSFIIELGQIPENYQVQVEFDYFMDLKVQKQTETRSNSDSNSEMLRLFIPMSRKARYSRGGTPEINKRQLNQYGMNTKMYIVCEPGAKNISGKMSDGRARTITKHSATEIIPKDKWVVDNDELRDIYEDVELLIDMELGETTEAGYIIDAFECNNKTKESIYVTNIDPTSVRNAIKEQQTDDDNDDDLKDKEYIFVVDRSGSMSGGLMRNAKRALDLFLKQLPEGCKFNIYSFGSTYRKLWKESKPYDENNLAIANRHVKDMEANMGGTEIYSVLNEILTRPALLSEAPADANGIIINTPVAHIRDVIILTDGGVSNTQNVLQMVAQHRTRNRIFSVGIGNGASTELVNGVAKESYGEAIYVLGEDRMQQKVMELAEMTMLPSLTLKKVNFPQLNDYLADRNQPKRQIHSEVRLFYKFHRLNQKFFDKHKGQFIDIHLDFAIGKKSFTVARQFKLQTADNKTGLLAYYASQKMDDLDQELRLYRNDRQNPARTKEIRDDIILYSKAGNVLHKSTAFIGVAEKPNVETIRTYESLDTLHAPRQNVHRNGNGPLAGGMRNMALADSWSNNGHMPMSVSNGYLPPNSPPAGSMNFGAIKCGGTRRHQSSNYIDSSRILCGGTSASRRWQAESYSTDGMEEPLAGSAPPKKSRPDNNKEAHEVIIDLADFSGYWDDSEELWNTLSRYDARITKAEIEKLRPETMDAKVFLTVIVLVILTEYAEEFKTEWKLMTKKSRKFIKQASLPTETVEKIESDLRSFCNA